MSPLQELKEGIVQQNWTKVLQGYNSLTGENLAIKLEPFEVTEPSKPKKPKGLPKKTPKIIEPSPEDVVSYGDDMAGMDFSNVENTVTARSIPDKVENKTTEPIDPFAEFRMPPLKPQGQDSGDMKYAKAVPFFKREGNKFEDNNEEFITETKTDKKLIRTLIKKKQVAPTRNSLLSKVTCAKCHKDVEIAADLASKYGDGSPDSMHPTFFCDNCIK